MDRVVEALLDRPHVVNALDDAIAESLERAIAVAVETDASVLVLRGAGGNFCAGADLRHVEQLLATGEPALFEFIGRLRRICDALVDGPFVSVAIVEGYALAGGFEILTACDIAVARSDARIGDRHLEHALSPGIGVSVRIGHQLSSKRARYLALTGDILSGDEAAEWGLVSHAWDAAGFGANADKLIARLASRDVDALRNYKRMLNEAERSGYLTATRGEADAFEAYVKRASGMREGVARFNR